MLRPRSKGSWEGEQMRIRARLTKSSSRLPSTAERRPSMARSEAHDGQSPLGQLVARPSCGLGGACEASAAAL